MLEFRYDTQLLIEGENLDEDKINEYFTNNFKGDCLLAVGDEELIKIHFHTNEPWKVLEYCSQIGEIYDIVIEDMDRQTGERVKGVNSILLQTVFLLTVCFFFLIIIDSGTIKWFISIAKRPFRVIQIDCKNSRSSVDLIMFCFDFRYYFICIPVLIYNNL